MGKDKNSKDTILRAARKLFALKGYDGARVEEIAREAGVNKALIYYYFKSKEEIRITLFRDFFSKINGILISLAQASFSYDSESTGEFMARYRQCMEDNSDVLKTIMIESIKRETELPPVFSLVDFSDPTGLKENEVIENLKERGFNLDAERNQRLVTEFFTGVIPDVCFTIFKEAWCSHFGITEEELTSLYENAMHHTHEEYYRTNED